MIWVFVNFLICFHESFRIFIFVGGHYGLNIVIHLIKVFFFLNDKEGFNFYNQNVIFLAS